MPAKASSPRAAASAVATSGTDLIVVQQASEGKLPQRSGERAANRVVQLTSLLRELIAADSAIDQLAFRKSLEARADASVKALANDLTCYANFCARLPGPGLPASEARIVAYLEDCEARQLKPASVGRRLASLAVIHGLLGAPSPTRGPIVRDALRGFRRRADVVQRQAGPLRFGQGIGAEPAKGFALQALLQACSNSLPGLRDAALLSLAYDTGLRVAELVRVEVGHIKIAKDATATLTIPMSKTDQDGKGAFAWLSRDTVRRVDAWCDAAEIQAGPLFRRIGVIRTKPHEGAPIPQIPGYRWRLPEGTKLPNSAKPALATTTFIIGDKPLTPAAVRLIIKRTAQLAADDHLVGLVGKELDDAIAALSTHSLRVGLTQDLFASGEDAGPIAQALRWTSTSTALRYGRKLAPSSNASARMLGKLRE